MDYWKYLVVDFTRAICPACDASVGFAGAIQADRIGRSKVQWFRCPRCGMTINLARHRPRDPAPGGPASDRAGG